MSAQLRCLFILLMLLPYAASPKAEEQPEFDVLFLDAFLAKNSLDIPLEVITVDFEEFYLPLEEVALMLELPLVIDDENQHIGGWFLNEKNAVTIDLNAGRFVVGDKSGLVTNNQWVIEDDLLYIQAKALTDWFGIHSTIKSNTLKINFTSEQLLPAQAKLKRKIKHQRFDSLKGKSRLAHVIDDRYQWFTLPVFDLSSQMRWQDKAGSQSSDSSYVVTGSGDIAKHGSEYWFNQTPGNQQLRLKLHKKISLEQRDWYYDFGDIVAGGTELTGGGGLGRGFSFRNSNDTKTGFSTHRFEGNAQPGWEAELYRDDSLIDYLEVKQDGRYVFADVPVRMGKNNFKIILYGPQGEQKIIEESFTGFQLDQAQGQWTPTFSINQPNKRLIPLDFNQKDGLNINTGLSYGINDKLQASFGWQQQLQPQQEQQANKQSSQYINNALTGVWQNTVFNVASSFNPQNRAFGYKANVQSQWWNHDWQLSMQKVAGLQQQSSDSINLSVFGNQSLFSEQDNYSLSLDHFNDINGTTNIATVNFSANYEQLSLNNRWEAQKDSQGTIATGTTGISANFGSHKFRVEGRYNLWPKRKIETFSASYSRRFKSAFLQLRGSLRQSEDNSDISAQLSWKFDHFTLGSRLLVDEQKNVSAALTFSMSLGMLPQGFHTSRNALKRTATIKAMAFMDNNYNGRFDSNETPVAGVSFKGNDKWTNITTDERGVVYLPQAKTSSAQFVEFDPDSLDDPFLAVDKSRFSIQTHAGGLNELSIPIYQTTEIEGEITLQKTTDGQAKTQAAVPLLLIDLQGNTVKRILSEYDGFFIFDGVKPGQYRIVVETDYLKRKNYNFDQTIEINASKIDEDTQGFEVGTLLITSLSLNQQ